MSSPNATSLGERVVIALDDEAVRTFTVEQAQRLEATLSKAIKQASQTRAENFRASAKAIAKGES